MKGRFTLFFVMMMFSAALMAQSHHIQNIDSPTAYTLERGGYQVTVMGYDQGGIEMKTMIGLHDNLFLGVSFNIDEAIGKGHARPNVPGVIARIKITDGATFFPAIAIGYDSFYIGQYHDSDTADHDYNRIIMGPYVAFTSPIYLFGGEQYINYGARLPVQPHWEPDDVSYFLGIDIPLGEYFRAKSEIERVFWNFREPGDWLFNFGIQFNYVDQLGIEFAVMYEPGERLNRILRIEYRNQF